MGCSRPSSTPRSASRSATAYNEPYEVESLEKFLAGEPEEIDDRFRDWLALVRDATAEGKRFSRVRVVSLP